MQPSQTYGAYMCGRSFRAPPGPFGSSTGARPSCTTRKTKEVFPASLRRVEMGELRIVAPSFA
eukprot:2957619-Pyramimonas_sp.AAC.1